jgi:hypothetical protein
MALGRHGTALVMRTSRRIPAGDPEKTRNALLIAAIDST